MTKFSQYSSSKKIIRFLRKVDALIPYPRDQKMDIFNEIFEDFQEEIEISNNEQANSPAIFGTPREVANDITQSRKWSYEQIGFEIRFVSYFIDLTIGLAIGILISFLWMIFIGTIYPPMFQTTQPTYIASPVFISFMAIPWIVHVIMTVILEGKYSTTIGKRILGLWVVDSVGVKITWDQALLRSLSKLFVLFLLFDVLAGRFQRIPKHRFLDSMSKTRVIHCKNKNRPSRWSLILGLLLIVFGIIGFTILLPFNLSNIDLTDNNSFMYLYEIYPFNSLLPILGIGLIIRSLLINTPIPEPREVKFDYQRQNLFYIEIPLDHSSAKKYVDLFVKEVENLLLYKKIQKKDLLSDLYNDLSESIRESKAENLASIFDSPRSVAKDLSLSQEWNVERVGFGLRSVAYFIDFLISTFLGLFCYYIIHLLSYYFIPFYLKNDPEAQVPVPFTIILLITLIVPLTIFTLYFTIFEGIWATTPGKKLFSLYVVDDSGIKLSFKQSFIRNLSKMVFLLLLFDVIINFVQNKRLRRALDNYANTHVVRIV